MSSWNLFKPSRQRINDWTGVRRNRSWKENGSFIANNYANLIFIKKNLTLFLRFKPGRPCDLLLLATVSAPTGSSF